jgi:hypothetical protein
MRGQPEQPNLAGAFEDATDGEVALENEIAVVLDLADGVVPVQIPSAPLTHRQGSLRPTLAFPVPYACMLGNCMISSAQRP